MSICIYKIKECSSKIHCLVLDMKNLITWSISLGFTSFELSMVLSKFKQNVTAKMVLQINTQSHLSFLINLSNYTERHLQLSSSNIYLSFSIPGLLKRLHNLKYNIMSFIWSINKVLCLQQHSMLANTLPHSILVGQLWAMGDLIS